MKGIIWTSKVKYPKAEIKLNDIVLKYEKINISVEKHKKSIGNEMVLFSNGDEWRIVKASDCSRGIRCNISYIDYNIESDIVNTLIIPCTIAMPYQGFLYY